MRVALAAHPTAAPPAAGVAPEPAGTRTSSISSLRTATTSWPTAPYTASRTNLTQVGRSRLWAVTFDDVTKIATDGTPTAETEKLLDGTEGGDTYHSATGAFFHHHFLKR